MQIQQTPQVLQQPFAAQGDKNTIPNAATGTNKASLQEGFPPITGLPINQGGIPPERQDFNGAMNLNSQFYFAFQNGWWPTFTQEVSDAIGGYPQGAVLWLFDTENNVYAPLLSLVGNNTYNFNTNQDYIGQYWAKILPDSARGLQIGAVYFSQSGLATDNPGGLPLWTGEYFSNGSSLYPDFYNWVKSHTELCKTKTEYDTSISTYGECPYYVVDEVEGSLRLPKYALPKRELTSSKAATENDPSWYNLYSDGWLEQGGTVVDPQTVTLVKNFASTDYEVLLSVKGYDNTTNWCPVVNTKTVNSFYIHSIGNGPQVVWRAYGWSGPVLQNMARYPWIYAFNSAVSAGEVQAAEFTGALVSKADTDLSNVSSNIDYVVESYTDAEMGQWYRLWKSGWLEQGGFLPGPTPGPSTTTVTFLKEFNDLNYYPVFTNCWDSYVENGTSINNLTTTGMNIPWYASRGTERSRWYACGQASTEE